MTRTSRPHGVDPLRIVSRALPGTGLVLAALWTAEAEPALRLSATFSWLLACVVSGFLLCAHAFRLKLREEGVSPALATMEEFDPRLLGHAASSPPGWDTPWVRCFAAGVGCFATGLAGLGIFYYRYLAIAYA
jgi:hypothetical protein